MQKEHCCPHKLILKTESLWRRCPVTLNYKGLLGPKWDLPMLKLWPVKKLQMESRKVKTKKQKKKVFRLSDNFLKFRQDCLLCWITGLLYLLLCLFIRAHLSGFSSSLFPSHMLPLQGPPIHQHKAQP